jgi:pyruvate, water dikinase
MSRIVVFEHAEATRPDLVGGKGANLGLLTQAGFQVPDGFVVTTESYAEFLQATGLTTKVEGALNLIPDGATITLNGDTGEVFLDDGSDDEDTEPPAADSDTPALAQVGIGAL